MPKAHLKTQFELAYQRQHALFAQEPHWLQESRQHAFAEFQKKAIPTRKQEAWKYLDVERIFENAYSFEKSAPTPALENLLQKTFTSKYRAVFMNGVLRSEYSLFPTEIEVKSLSQAASENGKDLAFWQKTNDKQDVFTHLNQALSHEGVYIRIPQNYMSDDVLQIVHLVDREQAVFQQNVLVLEAGASLNLLETTFTAGGRALLDTNFNILLENSANLSHVRYVHHAEEANIYSQVNAQLKKAACYESFQMNLSNYWCRQNLQVEFLEEGGSTSIDGFYSLRGSEILDNHTEILHSVANCSSHQLYKGIVDDKARAIFDGRIYVAPHANGTNSSQLNNNILLTNTAEVDTKPQLEIYADDVKCSHGATLGQMNEDEVFYFLARAIPEAKAREMIAIGFAQDSMQHVRSKLVKEYLIAEFREYFHKKG
jgi:Fe-S cluster assembly protein SufD